MIAIASQITSLTVVYSTDYSEADQRKHQSSASLALVNSPHKWPVTRKMLPFDDVIMGWGKPGQEIGCLKWRALRIPHLRHCSLLTSWITAGTIWDIQLQAEVLREASKAFNVLLNGPISVPASQTSATIHPRPSYISVTPPPPPPPPPPTHTHTHTPHTHPDPHHCYTF